MLKGTLWLLWEDQSLGSYGVGRPERWGGEEGGTRWQVMGPGQGRDLGGRGEQILQEGLLGLDVGMKGKEGSGRSTWEEWLPFGGMGLEWKVWGGPCPLSSECPSQGKAVRWARSGHLLRLCKVYLLAPRGEMGRRRIRPREAKNEA